MENINKRNRRMKKLKINLTPINLRMIISFLVSLAMLSSIGLADWNCINNSFTQYSTTLTVGSSSTPLSFPKNCTLSGGCNPATGECYPSPYGISIMDVGLLFGIIVFALLFFYLSFKLGTTEGAGESDLLKVQAFKTFFFMVGLIFLLASQLIMINYVSLINKGSSMGFIEDMLWFILAIIAISVVILFIMILKDVVNLIAQKKILRLQWR
jgi:uncharacterized membrane protein YhdT